MGRESSHSLFVYLVYPVIPAHLIVLAILDSPRSPGQSPLSNPFLSPKPVPITHRYTITALVLRLYTTYEAAYMPYYIYVRTAYLDDGTATAR